MFTAQQFYTIDRDYFIVLETTPLYIRVQSKNTRHFWRIYAHDKKGFCRVQHAHGLYDGFHEQHIRAKSLEAALNKIIAHDKYQLSHRPPELHRWDEYKPIPVATAHFGTALVDTV